VHQVIESALQGKPGVIFRLSPQLPGYIGLLSAAYNFGSTPPLEGGGIFQVGFNYGGGIRYRITPRWMIRLDYRETLTSQPDF
jgi:opacity protein-like surface antigen